jgi:starch synthase
VLDAPHLFDRDGGPYADRRGQDFPDNAYRFAALCRAAADVAWGDVRRFRPDVVHCHDWQAGLAPAYLHYAQRPRPRTVMTVHNMAFQGQFDVTCDNLGLPWHAWSIEGCRVLRQRRLSQGGLQLADRITTVSPTYAEEIKTPDGGMGLDGLLRHRAHAAARHPQRHRRSRVESRRRSAPARTVRREASRRARREPRRAAHALRIAKAVRCSAS